MNNFIYTQARTVESAIGALAATPDAQYLAGGTNIIDLMKYNLTRPPALVDVRKIDAYHAIEPLEDGGTRLGAFVTNADTAYHATIESRYPLLSRAILAGASPQIRNMATNGGNLLQRTRCYYFYDENTPCNKREPGTGCSALHGYNRIMAVLGASPDCIAVFPSDMCVALAALDAVVHVSGPEGNRSIAFSEFHRLPGNTPEIDNTLRPGEIILHIDLPSKGFEKNYSYLKLRDRNSYAFALVSVATGLELENGLITEARIALGGLAHKPWRVPEAEQSLVGKAPERQHFAAAAEIIMAGAKGYEYNDFKIGLAKKAIVRNCLMALNPDSQMPGAQPSDS